MAITDWLQYTQSLISGLIASFLLAKLFSFIFSNEQQPHADVIIIQQDDSKKKVDIDDDDDDDWEGVESTELDEKFSEATRFVVARGGEMKGELKMVMYGLYKIATEGPCCVAQPSAIKITSRAKWNAWHKLGAMPPEEAMQKYIDIVTKLYSK